MLERLRQFESADVADVFKALEPSIFSRLAGSLRGVPGI
jgi:hypothetical protein